MSQVRHSKMILFVCPSCENQQWVGVQEPQDDICCEHCSYRKEIIFDETLFDKCLFCECRAFFVQKSIHPLIMFGGLAIAILLSPRTYGISFVFLWLIDCLLAKVICNLLVCYRCRSSFRGFHFPKRFKNFQHHIGEKYDQ